MSLTTLRYRDERDRAYGLAGMALGLIINDGEQFLDAIDLDAPGGDMLLLSPAYYFPLTPSTAPRAILDTLTGRYTATVGTVIGGILSRCYVNDGEEITPDCLRLLHNAILDEGRASCQLEEEEINAIFNKQFNYMRRVFRSPSVNNVVSDLATTLRRQRRLPLRDLLDLLAPLGVH